MNIYKTACLVLALTGTAYADQVCNDNIDFTAPGGRYRFSFEGNLVIDNSTGLAWQRCPLGYIFSDAGTRQRISDDRCLQSAETESTFTWQAALQATMAFNDGIGGNGRSGAWYLPNAKELSSLVEARCVWPAINATVFPDTGQVSYWSSTPRGDGSARSVNFATGTVTSAGKDTTQHVRLVHLAADLA